MRPNPYTLLALFFLLSGAVFAFMPSDYFYPDETVTVTREAFVYDGDDYELLYFNGEETFLLKDSEPIDDSDEIRQVLYAYYREKYYPSEADLAEIRALVEEFNTSRNNGYDFKKKEEYSCREVIFTDKRIIINNEPVWCHDDESCMNNALLLYSAYGQGMGWGSYTVILQPLKDFSYASYGIDFILQNITYKLDTLEDQDAVDVFEYIDDSIPKLEDYVEDIEATVFRTPRLNDSADREACNLKCYAICPSFDLDEDVLDELREKSGDILDDIGPYAEYEETALKIHDNTMIRFGYHENATTASQYDSVFKPLEDRGIELEEYAGTASRLVLNTSFMIKFERMKELRSTIRGEIDGNEFASLDAEMDEYSGLLDEVEEGANALYAIYNETAEAKNSAELLLFEIGTQDLGPLERERLEVLRNQTATLDREFGSGMTATQLDGLQDNYTMIGREALRLLGSVESSGSSQAIVYFRAFARKMNDGLAQFAATTEITNVRDIPENTLAFGGFSLLVFLSFGSITLLFFLYLLRAYRHSSIKLIVVTGMLVSLLLIAFFSGSLFFFMQKTSTDATMDEFLVDFQDRETAAIVVDADLLTSTGLKTVSGCAEDLAQTLRTGNKTVYVYTLSGGSCTKAHDTYDENLDSETCLNEISESDSVIYLKPSSTIDEPKLTTTYLSRAEIYATENYYKYCPLVAMFN